MPVSISSRFDADFCSPFPCPPFVFVLTAIGKLKLDNARSIQVRRCHFISRFEINRPPARSCINRSHLQANSATGPRNGKRCARVLMVLRPARNAPDSKRPKTTATETVTCWLIIQRQMLPLKRLVKDNEWRPSAEVSQRRDSPARQGDPNTMLAQNPVEELRRPVY